MFGRSWKSWLIGAVVAAALLTGTSEANAWWCGWECYQPASCYTPCYVASCDPCGSGNWYLGVRPGPIRRLLFGPCRWYWSPSCGTTVIYDVCYMQAGTSAATPTPAAATPTPAAKPIVEPPTVTEPPVDPLDAPADTPVVEPPIGPGDDLPGVFPEDTIPGLGPAPGVDGEPPAIVPGVDTDPEPAISPDPSAAPGAAIPMPGSSYVPTLENSGLLTVWVPYKAKVTINGLVTHSKGSQRRYVSYGLKPGLDYKYVIRAEAVVRVKVDPNDSLSPMVDRLMMEEDEVILTAGDRKAVAFGFNPDVAGGLAAR